MHEPRILSVAQEFSHLVLYLDGDVGRPQKKKLFTCSTDVDRAVCFCLPCIGFVGCLWMFYSHLILRFLAPLCYIRL